MPDFKDYVGRCVETQAMQSLAKKGKIFPGSAVWGWKR